jgi:hypothetical protein
LILYAVEWKCRSCSLSSRIRLNLKKGRTRILSYEMIDRMSWSCLVLRSGRHVKKTRKERRIKSKRTRASTERRITKSRNESADDDNLEQAHAKAF